MDLRSVLRDLMNTTSSMNFDKISITKEDRGDGEKIYMESKADQNAIVMRAYVKESVPELVDLSGRFGLGQLGLLQGLLNLNTFKTEDTKIVPIIKDGAVKSLTFTSPEATTNFVVISDKLTPQAVKVAERGYEIQVTPSASKIHELKSFSSLFKSMSTKITPYTENGTLYFSCGEKNKNTSGGVLAFCLCDVEYPMLQGYEIDSVLSATARVANAESTEMFITNKGLMKIKVDTGIAVYEFFMQGSV